MIMWDASSNSERLDGMDRVNCPTLGILDHPDAH